MRRFNHARLGHKGGAGPNTGKKISTFEGLAPDGAILTYGGFHVPDALTASMYIYLDNGRWKAAAVRPEPAWSAAGSGRWIECNRVNPRKQHAE
jgi:hypothetical protein